MNFAETAFAFTDAEREFEHDLTDIQDFNYGSLGWDYYDTSLEFISVANDVELTKEALKYLEDNGFYKVYVNHKNGWETHYQLHGDDKNRVGYRTKNNTKNGGEDILVEKVPDGIPASYLETGYFKIVKPERD